MTDETTSLIGNQSRMTGGSSPMTGNRATANQITTSPQARAPARTQLAEHRKPADTGIVGNAWSMLPDDARYAVNRDIFDRFSLAQQADFHRVYAALKKVGYWGAVRQVKDVNVEFHQIDATVTADLKARLTADLRFCAEVGVPNLPHRGQSSFRQVVHPPGTEALHISIPPDGISQLHLDAVSPVIGRAASGLCTTGMGVGLEHLFRDKLHVTAELPHASELGETPF